MIWARRRTGPASASSFLLPLALIAVLALAAGCRAKSLEGRRQRAFGVLPAASPASADKDSKSEDEKVDRGKVAGSSGRGATPPQGATTWNSPSPPWASHKWVRQVSWEAALSWWPDRPLLRALSLPKPGSEEAVFAGAPGGGTAGSPRSQYAGIFVWYQYPPRVVRTDSFNEVIEGGGYAVFVTYHPPGTVPPWTGNPLLLKSQRPVVVRGHSARLMELRKEPVGDSNVDWRAIRWEESSPDGGVVQWEISTHPLKYTEQESIDFVDRLAEVR